MSVPASKVKAICTAAEVALVRASRQPALGKLSLAETKQHAQRARTLADKWEGLRRGQVRDKSRATGGIDSPGNTKLKAEIFRDALDSFSARLVQLESAGAPLGKAAKSKPKPKRSVEHRATRAEVRKQLASKEAVLNAPRRKKAAKKKAASKSTAAASASVQKALAKPGKKTAVKKKVAKASAAPVAPPKKKAKKKPAKKMTMLEGVAGLVALTPGKQRQAKTAAKQRRIAAGGLTSRVRGHVSARGRRAQAARDSRNG